MACSGTGTQLQFHIHHQRSTTETDIILEVLERWKKRVIAGFLLLSLIVTVTAVLLFEFGGVLKIREMEFRGSHHIPRKNALGTRKARFMPGSIAGGRGRGSDIRLPGTPSVAAGLAVRDS